MRRLGQLLFWTLVLALAPTLASAEEAQAAGQAAASGGFGYALGAGLAVGLAGLGCGLGQGLAAANTNAGIARNPGAAGQMFLPFILAMAFIESIAIYGLVVGFSLIP